MSAEEVANQLVAFDWELFSCVHEVSDIITYFFRDKGKNLNIFCRWSLCVTCFMVNKPAGAP